MLPIRGAPEPQPALVCGAMDAFVTRAAEQADAGGAGGAGVPGRHGGPGCGEVWRGCLCSLAAVGSSRCMMALNIHTSIWSDCLVSPGEYLRGPCLLPVRCGGTAVHGTCCMDSCTCPVPRSAFFWSACVLRTFRLSVAATLITRSARAVSFQATEYHFKSPVQDRRKAAPTARPANVGSKTRPEILSKRKRPQSGPSGGQHHSKMKQAGIQGFMRTS